MLMIENKQKMFGFNNEMKFKNLIWNEEQSKKTNEETELLVKKKEELKNLKNLEDYMRKNKALKESFELLKFVDSGGESNVYSIHLNIKNNTSQYLKKRAIMKIFGRNRQQKEHREEAIISAKLKHKNIINFFGYSNIKPNESSLMILEEAKYGNLRNFQRNILNRYVFSETMIHYVTYQILNALQYCHRCKIAHLDLKPQNIVVDEYLNFKLIDFSISLNYQNMNKNEDIELPTKGTNFYIPLEVLKSRKIKAKEINKVDLYSLGVVLYNLAFGSYPYQLKRGEENNFKLIAKKLEEEKLTFKNDSEFSPHFLDFLTKLLEKDIKKRISLNEALNHYWIKGAELLMTEKEKSYNISIFASYLLTNHIQSFNEYIQKKI